MPTCLNPVCRADVAPDARFCSKCGRPCTPLAQCPACHRPLDESGRYCSHCGHDLGGQLLTANDVVRWQRFFEGVGWDHHKTPIEEHNRLQMAKSLPMPGDDPAEPWIFAVHHHFTLRKQALGCPNILPIGNVRPIDGLMSGMLVTLSNAEMAKVKGFRWLVATNRRLFGVTVYPKPYMVYERMIDYKDIVAVRCSDSVIGSAVGIGAWSVEILTSESPKAGIRLSWREKPTPSGLSLIGSMYASYFVSMIEGAGKVAVTTMDHRDLDQAVAGRFDRRADRVLDKFSVKREEGEQIMAMTAAFFMQFSPV